MAKTPIQKAIAALNHADKRINVPTAEMASLFEQQAELSGDVEREMTLPRPRPLSPGEARARDGDLDPQIVWNGAKIRITREQMRQLAETGELELGDAQLVWRGKDSQDWSDLVVNAPPIYRQEAIHPKHLIDDLKRMSALRQAQDEAQTNLFADFNGITDPEARAEFYQHAQHWTNRFILGDSLAVMASLAEREAMRGKVQCIYFDPPYGIKFNSNWQVSTLSRDVKDGRQEDVSREPEQVKAFRDTWKDGIHSYLTYLRDRLMVARELLTESGSIFVQIGDENVHRVRAVMDEVFGAENYVAEISYSTTTGRPGALISTENDCVLFYCKKKTAAKFRAILAPKNASEIKSYKYKTDKILSYISAVSASEKAKGAIEDGELAQLSFCVSQDPGKPDERIFRHWGKDFDCGAERHWKTKNPIGLTRLGKASRLYPLASQLNYVRYFEDNLWEPLNNIWLGRVDGFDQDEAGREGDEGCEVSFGLLAS